MRGMFRKATRASDTTETYWSRQESHEIELGNSTSGSESGGSQTGPLENRGDNHGGKDSIPATSSSHTEKEVDRQSNWDWSAGKLRVPDKNNHNTTDVDSTASQPTQGQADEIRVTRSRLIVILSISVAAAMVAFAIFRLASEQEVIGYKSKVCVHFDRLYSTSCIVFNSSLLHLFESIFSWKMHQIKSSRCFTSSRLIQWIF